MEAKVLDRLVTFAYFASRFVIIFLLPMHVSDMETYINYAYDFLGEGKIPYRDFPFEYPPLAYLLLLVPGCVHYLLQSTYVSTYRILFTLVILPFDYFLFRLIRKDKSLPEGGALYLLFTACFCFLLLDRLDLPLALLLAYPYWAKDRDSTFLWSWGTGLFLKVIPIFLFPLRIFDWPRPPSLKRFLGFFGPPVLLGILLAVGILATKKGGLSFLSHHANRGVQVESFLAGWAMLGKSLGLLPQVYEQADYGAHEVKGILGFAWMAKGLFWIMMMSVYAYLLGEYRKGRGNSLQASWLVLLTFLSFGYVLSPQFLLWLLPFAFPVARTLGERQREIFWVHLGGLFFLTGLLFSQYYAFLEFEPFLSLVLVLRNLLLLSLLGFSLQWFRAFSGRDFSRNVLGIGESHDPATSP